LGSSSGRMRGEAGFFHVGGNISWAGTSGPSRAARTSDQIVLRGPAWPQGAQAAGRKQRQDQREEDLPGSSRSRAHRSREAEPLDRAALRWPRGMPRARGGAGGGGGGARRRSTLRFGRGGGTAAGVSPGERLQFDAMAGRAMGDGGAAAPEIDPEIRHRHWRTRQAGVVSGARL